MRRVLHLFVRFWTFLTDGTSGRAFFRALGVCLALSVVIVLVMIGLNLVLARFGVGPAPVEGPDIQFWALTVASILFYLPWAISLVATFWNGQRFVLNSQ